jgi:hypothetical protein
MDEMHSGDIDQAAAGAFALLTAAADPAGAKRRLKEITDAMAEHSRIHGEATAALEKSEARAADIDARAAALSRREREFRVWVETNEDRVKKADLALRKGEADAQARERDLAAREADLRQRSNAHAVAVAALRQAVAA